MLVLKEKTEQKRDSLSQVQRLVLALARNAGLREMSELVTRELKMALDADSVCIYLKDSAGCFEMVAEIGCTEEFKRTWFRLPENFVSLAERAEPNGKMFYGTAQEFVERFPSSVKTVKQSGRQIIGYSALAVEGNIIGVLGFAYNHSRVNDPDKGTISMLIHLCSQALERARLSEVEKSASRAKSEFLGNISHELRSPLGVIIGYAELMKERDHLTPEQEKWLEVISRNARQVIELVDDVLDISKIEAAKLDVQPSRFNFKHFLNDIGEMLTLSCSQKGLSLKIDGDGAPDEIFADSKRLRQIIINLMGNAIKFTNDGTVTLVVRMSSVGVLEGTVSDTGLGIPSEYQQKIFEPFTQVDGSSSRIHGGTGLGLAISRSIARTMGGDLVLVSSEPNQGSIFRFTINCRKSC